MNQNSDDKISIHVLTSSGKSFHIPVKEDLDIFEECHAFLSKKGLPDDELKHLIFSPAEPEDLPPAAVPTDRVRAVSVNKENHQDKLPKLPKSKNKNEFIDMNKNIIKQ